MVTPFHDEWPELGRNVMVCTTREEFDAACEWASGGPGRFAIVWTPPHARAPMAVGIAAEWAMHLGDCTLIVDEAHDSCNNRVCSDEILTCVKQGRHYNVGVWCISQRPSDVHASLRAELHASEAYYCRLVEHRDLDVLRGRRGDKFARRVSRLRDLQVLRLDPSREHPLALQVQFDAAGNPRLIRDPDSRLLADLTKE